MRLRDKVAIVVGGGQTPGDNIGNGRAAAALFARHGAKVLVVDRNEDSAKETEAFISSEGGVCRAVCADATKQDDCKRFVDTCVEAFGRLDILHNNIGSGAGDNGVEDVDEVAWDRIYKINVKSVMLACKFAVPVMRAQGSGVILNVSSIASICAFPLSGRLMAYKSSKAAVNSLTHALTIAHAADGIRVNAILPGLIDTPMAVDAPAGRLKMDKSELARARDSLVPLGGKMGSAWDVAHAALFLASDEARFITGALLPVDGGQSSRIG